MIERKLIQVDKDDPGYTHHTDQARAESRETLQHAGSYLLFVTDCNGRAGRQALIDMSKVEAVGFLMWASSELEDMLLRLMES